MVVSIFTRTNADGFFGRRFFRWRNEFAVELQLLDFAFFVANRVDDDLVFALERALEQFFGKRIFDEVFQCTTQWSSTVVEVGSFLDQELFGIGGQFQFETTFGTVAREFSPIRNR